MEKLDASFNIQPLIASLITLVIGYFLSKILTGIISAILPKARPSQGIDVLNSTWRRRTLKACFWFSWLIFIMMAINQIYDFKTNLPFQNINYYQLSLMGLFAYILIISEDWFSKRTNDIIDFSQKINPIFRILWRYIWIPLLIIFVIAYALPQTPAHKIAITVFILFAGLLVSKAVKEVLAAALGVSEKLQIFIIKFLSYFVFTYFLVAAIRLWH